MASTQSIYNKWSKQCYKNCSYDDDDELFYGMVDWWKEFSLISSQAHHCQRSSPSQTSDTPQAGFHPVHNLSSGLIE